MNRNHLETIHREQIEAFRRFVDQSVDVLLDITEAMVECLNGGGKILLLGNGGSAADAQHVAGELVGRFYLERKALPAIALTTDTSILTAIGNDYDIDRIFSRQVEALAQPEDIVVGISTSGRSPNVLRALEAAGEIGSRRIGFTGGTGGELPGLCDICFIAPADKTPRIQELHIAAWHAICEMVEAELF